MGHLASECFSGINQKYEFVEEVLPPEQQSPSLNKRKSGEFKDKKQKKEKKAKKE